MRDYGLLLTSEPTAAQLCHTTTMQQQCTCTPAWQHWIQHPQMKRKQLGQVAACLGRPAQLHRDPTSSNTIAPTSTTQSNDSEGSTTTPTTLCSPLALTTWTYSCTKGHPFGPSEGTQALCNCALHLVPQHVCEGLAEEHTQPQGPLHSTIPQTCKHILLVPRGHLPMHTPHI